MLTEIELKEFKCFKHLILPLGPLTVLSGVNASGKSSVIHALLLLHQTMQAGEYTSRLLLNGPAIKLGTVVDVMNQSYGRDSIEIGLRFKSGKHKARCGWIFRGERKEMSMKIAEFHGTDGVTWKSNAGETPDALALSCLLPTGVKWTEEKVKGQVVSNLHNIRHLAYLSAERIGPRDTYPLDDYGQMFIMSPGGENAVGVLNAFSDKDVPEDLCIEGVAPKLNRQVEAWMEWFFPGFTMEVTPVSRANNITLGIRTSDAADFLRPANTGFGVTQVLPLIVATLSRDVGNLLLIENPEVHLHPEGQAKMGQFLSRVAQAGVQVIIETHSDHILNGIRRSVRDESLPGSDVALHFFRPNKKDGTAQVESPVMDNQGNIDYWPEGFFDQFDKDTAHFAGWD